LTGEFIICVNNQNDFKAWDQIQGIMLHDKNVFFDLDFPVKK